MNIKTIALEELKDLNKEADVLNCKAKYLGKKSELNELLSSSYYQSRPIIHFISRIILSVIKRKSGLIAGLFLILRPITSIINSTGKGVSRKGCGIFELPRF